MFLVAASLLIPVALMFLFTYCFNPNLDKSRLPPGPRPWPIIGNLNLLGNLAHQTLSQLSKHYGPIFLLHLGSMPAVVASSAEIAKELLQVHDKVFVDRPHFEASKRLLYGEDSVFFMPYGARWRGIRKFCTVELFTAKRLQSFAHVRMEEISSMLQDIEKRSGKGKLPIDIGEFVGNLAVNTMCRLLLTKRPSEAASGDRSFRSLIREMSVLAGLPIIGDFMPYLGWLDVFSKRRMDRLHKQIDEFLEKTMAERHQDRLKSGGRKPNDFLDVLLSVNACSETEAFSNNVIKATVLDMLVAGVDTSAVTVEWAMAELLRNPAKLQKLRSELDLKIDNTDRLVNESDIQTLDYLKAVVKETLRLHPPGPLLIPRISNQPCQVAGYILPQKTRLIVNLWAIGRCRSSWERPEEFLPERFIGSNIDVLGHHFELIPFGAGRRICAGLPLGLSMVELTVANLARTFEWRVGSGEHHPDGEEVDMKEKAGISVCKAKPVLAIPTPRFGVPNP